MAAVFLMASVEVSTSPAQSGGPPAQGINWPVVAWVALLLGVCFAPILYSIGKDWFIDEDMGHGVFVPVIAGWIVWQSRARLAAVRIQRNHWGLALVIWGCLQLIVGIVGVEFFLASTAFWITLTGAVLYLGGWELLRAVSFPLFLLLFMIRIPSIVYNQITFPLQLFASNVGERALSMLGVPVLREGNILELPSQRLQVVEACSGIRSLLSLSFLSLIYGYLFDRKAWMRGVLLVATVPVAVGANAFRVTATGVLSEYKPDLAEGFFHLAEGWVVFLIALVALVLVHRIINLVWERSRRQAG
jgi:exosortase